MKRNSIQIIFLIICGFCISTQIKSQNENDFEVMKNIEIFIDIYQQINANYVDDIQHGKLMNVAIEKMLKELDPYTVYIPESEMEDYKYMTTGQYGGIGAIIHKRDNFVEIAEPYEESPAKDAGLSAGDMIIEIDGESAEGKSISDVSEILKGQPGTEVVLKIRNPITKEDRDVTIVRQEIKVSDVPYHGMVADGIAYIKLTGFTANVSKEFKEAFVDLNTANELDGLIIDLRGNGGGLLKEAVSICNLFIQKGEPIVSTKGKLPQKNFVYKTPLKALDTEIPIVVLVDGNSASASEIVSGAIQDLDRGIIIGENTYGKGLVQNVLPLNYNSKLKVTVAKYYIPSGRCIQAIDYSHRDENGKAEKIPDSLLVPFETRNGRLVYDGAGIRPDIEVSKKEYADISYKLISERIIFDYATAFTLQNPNIGNPRYFRISDEEYNNFIEFSKEKDIDYETETEELLKELEIAAAEEKYEENIVTAILDLEKLVLTDKEGDLLKFKEEICFLLQYEIASRYYYQKGRIESALDYDPVILKAVEVLKDIELYREILTPDLQ